jgi:NO-binding membrane sensor protein with MHYT domain
MDHQDQFHYLNMLGASLNFANGFVPETSLWAVGLRIASCTCSFASVVMANQANDKKARNIALIGLFTEAGVLAMGFPGAICMPSAASQMVNLARPLQTSKTQQPI